MRALVMIAILPIWAFCNINERPGSIDPVVGHYLNNYLSVEDGAKSKLKWVEFIEGLATKRNQFGSETDFARYIFVKTHNKFLRKFSEFASFSDMLANGRYNCLTATALYSLVFQNLSFKYNIFETSNHIFLSVETCSGKILIETTDRLNGFVTDAAQINERISGYRVVSSPKHKEFYYQFSKDILLPVNLDGVTGLLYFNAAARAYNQGDVMTAVDRLEKAAAVYYSSRIDEFAQIIYLTLTLRTIDPEMKQELMLRISTLRQQKFSPLAVLH